MLEILSICINITVLLFIALNIFLTTGGLSYLFRIKKSREDLSMEEYPFVSVIVPAHNEAVVIRNTIESLLAFNYPEDCYEIIVVNDNSSDNSADILKCIQTENEERNLIVINTNKENGGKGKSNALNIAMSVAKGEVISIYDADNTPEPNALRILIKHLMLDDARAAVVGKFRTRNKNTSILTRFINIETLAYQCMNQAGRYFYFKLCTIPGTNYVVRRSVIEKIGGWDANALSEDTEISFRIYRMGYYITFMPLAITWEQEPQKLKQWFKQRTRWARGNIYVYLKNIKYIFDKDAGSMKWDVVYYLSIYSIMFSALVFSDVIGIISIVGTIKLEIGMYFAKFWIITILIFVCNLLISLIGDREELNISNAFLILIMLFTYSKMWVIVVIYALYLSIIDKIRKKQPVWDKTVRYSETKENLY